MHQFAQCQKQVKPEKEFKDSVKEQRILRGELQKLRKENSRLRKLLEKEFNRAPEPEGQPKDTAKEVTKETSNPALCPKCNRPEIKSVQTPVGLLFVCEQCSHKWKRATKA